MWPGMSYYLTLFYPPSRTGKRIGQYYTAAQISAAVVGLVSAGFQGMDGNRGLVGFQWMFLVYGVVTVVVGVGLLWWLPDRPTVPDTITSTTTINNKTNRYYFNLIPRSPPALTGHDAILHYHDLRRVYHHDQHHPRWTPRDLLRIFLDWRLWPLLIMYFGVVGVGIGVQSYSTVIIQSTNPSLSSVQLSLLSAPIWLMDLAAILLVTPFSDRFHRHRALFFAAPVCVQIVGLLVMTFAGGQENPWPRYGGLLIVGFGLGPTVPVTMTWTNELFQPRHGELGVAAASAVVSGWGNLGSILTTYALYSGWKSDAQAEGMLKYRKSNLVMVGILCASILAAAVMQVLVWLDNRKRSPDDDQDAVDGAARRETQQRGLQGLGFGVTKLWKK